jgi:hypothetical protein
MAIVVTPTSPVIPAQGAGAVASGPALQPGTTVNAQVLGLIADNMVRIAIANLALDVLTEVPLTAGQNLQLAVSQTGSGIRLAIVTPDSTAAPPIVPDVVTLANAPAAGQASLPATIAPVDPLTPIERIAVSVAAGTAATQQASQAPLFANLAAISDLNDLPPALREAVTEVLAQQTNLDPDLDGGAIQNAVQKSGLFLEASLAAGALPPAGSVPDLKAALIVLRQALASVGATDMAAPLLAAAAEAAVPATKAVPANAAASPAAPSVVPEIDASEFALAVPRVTLAEAALGTRGDPGRIVLTQAAPEAVQAILSEPGLDLPPPISTQEAGSSTAPVAAASSRAPQAAVPAPVPPPMRGGLPSAQPVAAASIAPGTPLPAAAHRLLDDTDAAIARQTLLQVASLPDRVDASTQRIDPAAPQWHFEIPFATPQGTAMAQFEISRDGGTGEAAPANRVWRARFSLDVEPAGPVHALISLSNEKTSVRMWAERPATAAQLRAGAPELSQALSRAELVPGDIVIANGAPPQTAPARAGHFLDRAL